MKNERQANEALQQSWRDKVRCPNANDEQCRAPDCNCHRICARPVEMPATRRDSATFWGVLAVSVFIGTSIVGMLALTAWRMVTR